MMDYERVAMLLDVIEKAVAHGSSYQSIIGLAQLELADINADAQEIIIEHAKEKADEEAKALAEVAARQETEHVEHAAQLRTEEPLAPHVEVVPQPPASGMPTEQIDQVPSHGPEPVVEPAPAPVETPVVERRI